MWQPLGWPRGAALRRADLVIGPSADTVQHLISEQGIRPEKFSGFPGGLTPNLKRGLLHPFRRLFPAIFRKRAGSFLRLADGILRSDTKERIH